MTALYAFFGITRQGVFAAWKRQAQYQTLALELGELVHQIRQDHPRMGLRKIHTMLSPLPVGRDRFEALMRDQGLGRKRVRKPWVTTHPQRHVYFPNLVAGRILTDVHQVWVTDITYFALPDRFAYIITIEDVYTRLIVSAVASLTLRAEANILALKRAVAATDSERGARWTIHHSDRGGQYIDTDYLNLLKRHHFHPSMCTYAWENPYVERIQGTIKNQYLYHRSINTIQELQRELKRTVHLYNTCRPHDSLPEKMPPRIFAQTLATIPHTERPVLEIYDPTKTNEADDTPAEPP